jgi:hypothetical protein
MKTKYALCLATACLTVSLGAVAGDAPSSGGDTPPQGGALSKMGSTLGGLFHKKPTPTTQQQNAGQIDCKQIANNPNAGMSYETCQQMLAAQQQYNASANDPSAARPGDEQMTCDQIKEELKQQTYTKPDAATVAQAQQAAAEHQKILAKQEAEATEISIRQTAEYKAAEAADLKADVATAGLAGQHATEAVEAKHEAENKATGERMRAEQAPSAAKMTTATGDLAAGMTQQLQSNPRLARLMQLAQEKKCKGA